MNGSLTDGGLFFAASLIIQLASILPLFVRKGRGALYFSNTTLLAGVVTALCATLSGRPFFSDRTIFFPLNAGWFCFDSLGMFFLFIIQLIAIPTTIYNFSYLRRYIDKGRPIGSFMIFYIIMIVATQLIVVANHAIFFLVSWEFMSISAYLAMIFEREKAEVQKGSFYYFAASHVLIFVMYILFFLLHRASGSWFFSDFDLSFSAGMTAAVFILSFTAFGIKAGFMPFHFWLPQAHPIAPTVLSAFLSGVLIKTGIYGIMRCFVFIKPLPEWCGWMLLGVSVVSAVLGVWYALAQHDIKRLLAYHSIENIGIIGMGIGIGFIGAANNNVAIEVLGFGGALLHTLNHAIFKTLLFIGSGVIYQNLGTRNIEQMGGVLRRAKFIALFFLIGSVAICGLPPFNGFISEFVIYSSFFRTARELKRYYPIIMLMTVVSLAFVGGLAVACFTKANSIIFLGSERTKQPHFKLSIFDHLSMGILAALCIVIGVFPHPFVELVNRVISDMFITGTPSSALVSIDWTTFTLIFSSIAAGIVIIYLLKVIHEKKYVHRISHAWGCSCEDLTPRMQYTASSFADELNTVPRGILLYHKKIKFPDGVFPADAHFESHSEDLVDRRIVMPAFYALRRAAAKIEFFSQTDIRYYIAFMLLMITLYTFTAFVWK